MNRFLLIKYSNDVRWKRFNTRKDFPLQNWFHWERFSLIPSSIRRVNRVRTIQITLLQFDDHLQQMLNVVQVVAFRSFTVNNLQYCFQVRVSWWSWEETIVVHGALAEKNAANALLLSPSNVEYLNEFVFVCFVVVRCDFLSVRFSSFNLLNWWKSSSARLFFTEQKNKFSSTETLLSNKIKYKFHLETLELMRSLERLLLNSFSSIISLHGSFVEVKIWRKDCDCSTKDERESTWRNVSLHNCDTSNYAEVVHLQHINRLVICLRNDRQSSLFAQISESSSRTNQWRREMMCTWAHLVFDGRCSHSALFVKRKPIG